MAAGTTNRFRILKLSTMEAVANEHGEHCSVIDLRRCLRNARSAILRAYEISGELSEDAAVKTFDSLWGNPLIYYSQVVSKRVAARAKKDAYDRELEERANKSYTMRGRRQHLMS